MKLPTVFVACWRAWLIRFRCFGLHACFRRPWASGSRGRMHRSTGLYHPSIKVKADDLRLGLRRKAATFPHSHSRVAKKLSHMRIGRSVSPPIHDGRTPLPCNVFAECQRRIPAALVRCDGLTPSGRLGPIAISSASITSSCAMISIDQPTHLRLQAPARRRVQKARLPSVRM